MHMNKEERYLIVAFDHAFQETENLLLFLQGIEDMSGWDMTPPKNYLNLVKRDLYEWLKAAKSDCDDDTGDKGTV